MVGGIPLRKGPVPLLKLGTADPGRDSGGGV